VWRYRVLLTGNFPSTINHQHASHDDVGLDAHQQVNQQVTRCHADALQITQYSTACLPVSPAFDRRLSLIT
jgi:hypothetical protein